MLVYGPSPKLTGGDLCWKSVVCMRYKKGGCINTQLFLHKIRQIRWASCEVQLDWLFDKPHPLWNPNIWNHGFDEKTETVFMPTSSKVWELIYCSVGKRWNVSRADQMKCSFGLANQGESVFRTGFSLEKQTNKNTTTGFLNFTKASNIY